MVQAQRRGPLALAAGCRGGGMSQQGNLALGFDIRVGVYQAEKEEHPETANISEFNFKNCVPKHVLNSNRFVFFFFPLTKKKKNGEGKNLYSTWGFVWDFFLTYTTAS